MSKRVVIVGGGISGLATAHALVTKHRDRGFDVQVLEATDRLGGNIRTFRSEGYLIDEGPDSWVVNKPRVAALARALGLGDRLIETIPANRRVYVRTERGLEPLPEGLMLGIPTRLWPLVTTSLLSFRGKVRAAADLVLPIGFGRRSREEDEPLGEFIDRRLGREVRDNLVGPLLGGLFTGDVDALSLLGTFPQLAALEQRGGLIRGAFAQARRTPKPSSGVRPSGFMSLRGGVGELIDTLAARLGDLIVRNASVEHITREGDRLVVNHSAGPTLSADHVVLAGPAHVAARLLRPVCEAAADELGDIPYASSCTVFVAYPRSAIMHPLDATGYLVPRKAPGEPLASTWVSSKWPSRAPADRALIRVFFGQADVDRDDDDLIARAHAEVRRTLSVSDDPHFVHVARFRRASPQPRVGHPERLRRLRAALSSVPGVHVVGSAYEGVGLGDCVRQGEEIAAEIASDIRLHPSADSRR
jgi:protoporphyrinogen/coproporphyrinogen III oxidase